jgi:hypothetical protein
LNRYKDSCPPYETFSANSIFERIHVLILTEVVERSKQERYY